MVTAALARRHRRAGRRVRVFKCEPAFLDPMILERASGAPVPTCPEARCAATVFTIPLSNAACAAMEFDGQEWHGGGGDLSLRPGMARYVHGYVPTAPSAIAAVLGSNIWQNFE